jgi:hypothetical protein
MSDLGDYQDFLKPGPAPPPTHAPPKPAPEWNGKVPKGIPRLPPPTEPVPVETPLEGVLYAIFLALVAIGAMTVFALLGHWLGKRVKWVGGWLADRAAEMARWIGNICLRIYAPWSDTVPGIMVWFGSSINQLQQSLGDFGDATANAIDYLTNVRLFNDEPAGDGLPKGRITRIYSQHNLLNKRLYDPEFGFVPFQRGYDDQVNDRLHDIEDKRLPDLRGRVNRIDDPEDGTVAKVRVSVQNLLDRLFDPETGAIPQLRAQLKTLTRKLYDPETGDVPQLQTATQINRDKIGKIEGELAPLMGLGALTALEPVIATLTAAANEPFMKNENCRSKLNDVCATDPGAWADLMGAMIGGLALLSFGEMAKIAYETVHEIEGSAIEYAKRAS